ncbi:MAG TPA: hypothetical protein VKQ73_06885 [Stellaceae bacterium]|nr:hypothetical protein [Stellaceae bacterium]
MSVPALRDQAGAARERWRVVVALPPPAQLALMLAWLDDHWGRARWSAAPAGRGGVVNDAVAFYFADRAAARAFIGRFCCGYRASP